MPAERESLCAARNRGVFYKALRVDGLSTVRKSPWPLPTEWEPGEWLEVEGELVLCRNGLHAYKTRERAEEEGEVNVYELEFDGPTISDREKVAGSRARLIRLVSHMVGDLRYGYPCARHFRERDGTCCVECGCGHVSRGKWFGAVWMEYGADEDVWQIHARHMDECCPERRTPQWSGKPKREDFRPRRRGLCRFGRVA